MMKQIWFAIAVVCLSALWFIAGGKEKEATLIEQSVLVDNLPSAAFTADRKPLATNTLKHNYSKMKAPIVKETSIRAKDAYQPSDDTLNKARATPSILLRCIFEPI